MNKPETEELSSDAFMDKFIAECATQDWKEKQLNKAMLSDIDAITASDKLSANSCLTAKNKADASAASNFNTSEDAVPSPAIAVFDDEVSEVIIVS